MGLVFCSCSKEPEQNINAAFETYVAEFFEEGAKRGFSTTLNEIDIIVEFGDLDDEIGGECTYSSTRKIIIDSENWVDLAEERKKWLIFHELGHCILDRRGHLNERIGAGECTSIMKGTEGDFRCTTNFYSKLWWDYYLDELFDINTIIPNWYSDYNDYNALSIDSILLEIDTFSDELDIEFPELLTHDNFKIDIFFENENSIESSLNYTLDNIKFGFCPSCTVVNAQISINSSSAYRNQNGDFISDGNIKLSIVKKNGKLIHFVNETFIHIYESDIWLEEGSIGAFTAEDSLDIRIIISAIN